MGKGSSGTKTTYTQSPEQAQMYAALMPLVKGLVDRGVSNIGKPGMGMPSAPYMPSMSGVLTGVSPYDIPSAESMMPTQAWWNSISPEVKAGAWAPWLDAGNMLQEKFGGQGQLGNARGGYTGAFGAAMGELGSRGAQAVGQQLWGMSQPAMAASWNANLGRNITGYQQGLTEAQTDYANEVARRQAEFGMQQQAWGIPFGLTGMMPGTYGQGITTQPSSPNWLGMLGGGLLGGGMGYQQGGGVGGAIGGVGGGLMGGGK